MSHDKRPVILIAHSNPVHGANLAKQVEDYFYNNYRVQTVSTHSDAVTLRNSLGPNQVSALIHEQLDNNAVLPNEGQANGDSIQRITLSPDEAPRFDEDFQRTLEHTLYKAAPPQRPTVIVKGDRKKREVITIMRFLRLNSVLYSQVNTKPVTSKVVGVTLKSSETLDDPKLIDLATKLDLMRIAKPNPDGKYYCDVAIVGGGAAGLSAAVNLVALYGKIPLIIEEFAPGGGAVATANNVIQNYLGFPDGIQVADLANRWKKQADRYEIDWLPCYRATKVEEATGKKSFTLTVAPNNLDRDQLDSVGGGDVQVVAKKVLLACGIKVKKLSQPNKPVPGEDAYAGQGIYYSALAGDALLYRGNNYPVAIVGGGDTAGIAAIFFAQAGINVTMIIRSNLRKDMLEVNYTQIEALKDLIKVEEGATVSSFQGEDNGYLSKVLYEKGGKTLPIDVAAAYVLIGAGGLDKTTEDWLKNLGVPVDQNGVKTISPTPGPLPCFNMAHATGLFVAGDARAGSARRIITAVGDGSTTAFGIYNNFINDSK